MNQFFIKHCLVREFTKLLLTYVFSSSSFFFYTSFSLITLLKNQSSGQWRQAAAADGKRWWLVSKDGGKRGERRQWTMADSVGRCGHRRQAVAAGDANSGERVGRWKMVVASDDKQWQTGRAVVVNGGQNSGG